MAPDRPPVQVPQRRPGPGRPRADGRRARRDGEPPARDGRRRRADAGAGAVPGAARRPATVQRMVPVYAEGARRAARARTSGSSRWTPTSCSTTACSSSRSASPTASSSAASPSRTWSRRRAAWRWPGCCRSATRSPASSRPARTSRSTTRPPRQTKVVYVGSLAGLVPGGPGHSHQSVRDIATLGAVPGHGPDRAVLRGRDGAGDASSALTRGARLGLPAAGLDPVPDPVRATRRLRVCRGARRGADRGRRRRPDRVRPGPAAAGGRGGAAAARARHRPEGGQPALAEPDRLGSGCARRWTATACW